MSNSDKILEYLRNNNQNICDDCLSKILEISPRQQINQICNNLYKKGLLIREKNRECIVCQLRKITNTVNEKTLKNKDRNNNKVVSELIASKTELTKQSNNIESYDLSRFKEVKLNFIDTDIDNKFYEYKKYLLKEVLLKDKYRNIQNYIEGKYKIYLNCNLNDFLLQLKNKHNPDYNMFLNQYGDLKYCKFKILGSEIQNSKGVYLYKLNDEVVYIGRCLDNFEKRINYGYANISPKNCYLDGQSTNCRINNLINENRNNIKLFILKLDDDETIKGLEIKLIKKYKPKWNIQGI